ncbi:MAG: NAD-dependent epimerase/dehydratase family protein [Woeseiaceae bacterium]
MKILFTGATGFLGGWLINHFLNSFDEVIVLRNKDTRTTHKSDSQYQLKKYAQKCRELFVDLLDSEAVANVITNEQPYAIIHLAAVGDVTVAIDNPKSTYEVSSNGTLNLLEAIRKESPDTFFISHTTDKVYSGNAVPFREEMFFNPTHIYEAAKVSQEYLTSIYAKSYGVRAVTIRCGNYFGGFDFNFNRIVPYVIKCALQGDPVQLRSKGNFTRDFLYIKDAVLVNQLVLDNLASGRFNSSFGEAFNFSLETQLSVIDVVRLILELVPKDVPIEIVGEGANEIPDMRLDCSKAKSFLKWAPQYSFEDGLLETIDFYKAYH